MLTEVNEELLKRFLEVSKEEGASPELLDTFRDLYMSKKINIFQRESGDFVVRLIGDGGWKIK